MSRYPRWSELTQEEKNWVNNGCGPKWLPLKYKKIVEKWLFGWMFYSQCGRHDWGYTVGGSELRRLECDLKFGKAILKDALRNYMFAIMGTVIAPIFFLLVLLFGWLSFNYGDPLTKEQVLRKVR